MPGCPGLVNFGEYTPFPSAIYYRGWHALKSLFFVQLFLTIVLVILEK